MTTNDTAFEETVAHAIRLHRKMQMLEAQLRSTLEVAASLAGYLGGKLTDPLAWVDAVAALRSHEVPGRGVVTGSVPAHCTAHWPARWVVGSTNVFVRPVTAATPWPGRGIACVYLLADADNHIFYIGKSINMRARIKGHATKPWAAATVMICQDEAEALELEGDLIYHHQPNLNVADRQSRRYAGVAS